MTRRATPCCVQMISTMRPLRYPTVCMRISLQSARSSAPRASSTGAALPQGFPHISRAAQTGKPTGTKLTCDPQRFVADHANGGLAHDGNKHDDVTFRGASATPVRTPVRERKACSPRGQ